MTLVEGSAFCISDHGGDIAPSAAHGLFFRDTRFLSRFGLLVNGAVPEPLAAEGTNPFSATFVLRAAPSGSAADSSLLVFRHRYVGRGMREDIVVFNHGEESAYVELDLILDADFADLFHVKEGRADTGENIGAEFSRSEMTFRYGKGTLHRGARITFGDPATRGTVKEAHYEIVVPARGSWSTCIQVTPVIEGQEIEPRYLCGQPIAQATPEQRMEKWRRDVPAVQTDFEVLKAVVDRSAEDLGALRIFDPDFPERTVVAAGAPWFMTLFGRDSLLTAWMALVVDPDLALGVLQTLARFQGTKEDASYDEEPGKILHEMRFGDAPSLSLGGGRVYYGSVDSTPLFVMLLGELRRWGLATELVDSLLPHADRAMAWIEEYGDRDGDGYIEYLTQAEKGPRHQGWKDSDNAIVYEDGRQVEPPLAVCEIQGYYFASLQFMAVLSVVMGERENALSLWSQAKELKERFNRDFWMEEEGFVAQGLDSEKRQIKSLTSNAGQCLTTGIVSDEHLPR
ncbi:MAG: amylo-alpha-1,6-glucosidase, partial [Actinomycetota bacterium]|nr:amylo-alpha-1,6-glucosidase [Actinomycetota bacterium]